MITVCSDWPGLVGVSRVHLCFITSLAVQERTGDLLSLKRYGRDIWRYWELLQPQGFPHCFVLKVDSSLTSSSWWGNQGFYSLNDFPKVATFKYWRQNLITSIGAHSCSCYDKYLQHSYLTLASHFFIFPWFLNVDSSGHLGLAISTTPYIPLVYLKQKNFPFLSCAKLRAASHSPFWPQLAGY